MNTASALPYQELPALPGLLVKALVSPKPGLKEDRGLMKFERSVSGAVIDPHRLSVFNRLCGFEGHSGIPLPYYYVLAQRIQLVLLTDRAFPLAIPGLIHISNSFRLFEETSPGDTLDLICRIGEDTAVPAGREFEIVTDFHKHGRKAVECRSRFLSRNKKSPSFRKPKSPSLPLDGDRLHMEIAADAGRRYAQASGDYNPIHLYAWSARLFGFKRPIAQGMYMLSLVTARLEKDLAWPINTLTVDYKLPVYLPCRVELIANASPPGENWTFEVRSGSDERLHLKGSLSAGAE